MHSIDKICIAFAAKGTQKREYLQDIQAFLSLFNLNPKRHWHVRVPSALGMQICSQSPFRTRQRSE